MKSKTIQLDKKYEIEELPLGKYRALFKKVKFIYDKVSGDVGNMESTPIFEALPLLLDKAWDEMLDLLHFASGVPVDTLENKTGMGGVIKLAETIWEVNDIELLKKRLQPLFQTATRNSSQNLGKSTVGVPDKSSKKSPNQKPQPTSK